MSLANPTMAAGQLALNLLTAKADARGAPAEVTAVKAPGSAAETSTLRYDINQIQRDEVGFQAGRSGQAKETAALFREESQAHVARQLSYRAVERLEKRTAEMASALARLQSGPLAKDQIVLSLFSDTQRGAVSINTSGSVAAVYLRGGDQALSATAGSVDSVYTGGGQDAISIKAESVSGVYTDRSTGYELTVRDNGERYARRAAGTSSNDAVAIEARRASSVYTGAGNDFVAIQANLVGSVYGGAGRDAISLTGGIVSGIHGEAGADVISVTAAIGGSALGSTFGPGNTAQGYVRPATAEGRMRLAAVHYSDVLGGTGNDTISVTVSEVISVEGGEGDDVISIGGGTVGLRVGSRSGNDIVKVAQGAELFLQIDRGSYRVEIDGSDMVVVHSGGSVRIEDYESAAAISVGGSGSRNPPDPAELAGMGAMKTALEEARDKTVVYPLTIDPENTIEVGFDFAIANEFRILHMSPPEPVNRLA